MSESEDKVLRTIVEGVESETGERFFASLVRHLATALEVQYVFVSELSEDRTTFRTRALWGRGILLENFTSPLSGTPCEAVLGGQIAYHRQGIQTLFPEDTGLVDWAVESYCGVPLLDSGGTVLGHLAILDDKPMLDESRSLAIMRIFAARARAEVERLQAESALRDNEARYRDLYDEAPIMYLSLGVDGRIQRANHYASHLLGCTLDHVIEHLVFDFLADSPAGKPRARAILDRFRAGEETLNSEIEWRRTDGTPLWTRASVRPIFDAHGQVLATRSTHVDITDRKLNEQALRENEARYRDLYEEAPIMYLSLGGDGRIQRANHHTSHLLGYPLDNVIGRPVFEFLADSPSGKPRARAILERFRAGEETLNSEVEWRRADGTPLWTRASVRPIFDAHGQVLATRSTHVDITDRKLAEEALRESEERLARILDSAMDAIVTFDDARQIALFNRAAETVFGCPAAQAIGQSIDQFLTENFRHALNSAVQDLATGGDRSSYSWLPEGLHACRSDAQEFPIEATLSLAEVRGRRLYTVILRNIEDRQRAEKKLGQLHLDTAYLAEEIKSVHNFEEIVGRSRTLREALEKVRLVAATDATVLILGETGTGKELIARAVHSQSLRKERPLIKVNCAALPPSLIESELFGHEKGAFTGATERRVGRFELADGGTIFLDELGEMPADVQVKLLRVLQEREFERVGGTKPVTVDVRLIAATNRDLTKAVAEGKFRQDLFYRLNVFPVQLPPLRERSEDIPLLVHYFTARFATKIGRAISRVPKVVMERLVTYPWPGNVRELENVIERAVILSQGIDLEVGAELLPRPPVDSLPTQHIAEPTNPVPTASGASSLEQMERDHILAALKRTNWRIEGGNGAARVLNINPSTLRSRIKKLGIRRDTIEVS